MKKLLAALVVLGIIFTAAGAWADARRYGNDITVNGTTCTPGGSCTVADSTKLPLSTEVYCTATADVAISLGGTTLNSYGRGGAVTSTLPAASSGLPFVAVVGTQHNSAWRIQRAGSDTMCVDGTCAKTYIQETNQAVGSAIACNTFKTGSSAWTWHCTSVAGTWVTD